MRAKYMVICLLQSFFSPLFSGHQNQWMKMPISDELCDSRFRWIKLGCPGHSILICAWRVPQSRHLNHFRSILIETKSCISIIKMEICPPDSHCFRRETLSFFRIEPYDSASYRRHKSWFSVSM